MKERRSNNNSRRRILDSMKIVVWTAAKQYDVSVYCPMTP